MKDIKNITIYSLGYFTACGGLYHIGYWGKFGINGLEYISISDIIKSFVYPFVIFGLLYFAWYLLGPIVIDYLIPTENLVNPIPEEKVGKVSKANKFFHSKLFYCLSFVMWFALVIVTFIYARQITWFIWVSFTALLPLIVLMRSNFLRNQVENNKTRSYLINVLVALPLISFATGRYYSDRIYYNESFKYILKEKSIAHDSIMTKSKDTLKFLGKTENFLFFSDMDNSRTLMLNIGSADSIELYQK